MSEKQSRVKRYIVGLSGGLDSMVAAYLTRIQRHQLVAVCFEPPELPFVTDHNKFLHCHISPNRIKALRSFCEQMQIPLHVIKLEDMFMEKVAEKWVADRLIARKPSTCFNCHSLKMELLYQKMTEMEADGIVTGHYAKVFKRANVLDSVLVHSSNDEKNDQSEFLMRLPQKILNQLVLPLSELTKAEVEKLAENFGLSGVKNECETYHCFPPTTEATQLLEHRTPEELRHKGEIFNEAKDVQYGQHLGFHTKQVGEKIFEENRYGNQPEVVMLGGDYRSNIIFAGQIEIFKQQEFKLDEIIAGEDLDLGKPFVGYIYCKAGQSWIRAEVQFLCLNNAYIKTAEPCQVFPGEVMTIYKRKGKNSKILLSGTMIKHYRPKKEVKNEDNHKTPIDPNRCF